MVVYHSLWEYQFCEHVSVQGQRHYSYEQHIFDRLMHVTKIILGSGEQLFSTEVWSCAVMFLIIC